MAEQSTRVAFLEVDQSGFGFKGVSRATRTCGDPALRGSSMHSGRGDSGRVVGNSYFGITSVLPVSCGMVEAVTSELEQHCGCAPSRMTCGQSLLSPRSSTFFEHVFVLRISHRQCPLRSGTHCQLKTFGAWCNGDERHGAIGVLARGYFAFPLAKIKHRRSP